MRFDYKTSVNDSNLYLLLISAISGLGEEKTGLDLDTCLDFLRGVAIPHSQAEEEPPEAGVG